MGAIFEQLDWTGGTLYNGDNSVRPNPVPAGAVGIAAGSPNLTANGTGGTPAVPWLAGSTVFIAVGPAGLVCGNSHQALDPVLGTPIAWPFFLASLVTMWLWRPHLEEGTSGGGSSNPL